MTSAKHRCSYRVIYGDTDQMGVVYYANYLVLFERARCEYMRARGFDYVAVEKQGFFIPVVEANVRYKQPARFDDLLLIDSDITEASRVTATFTYQVWRDDGRGPGNETLLAEGSTVHACMNTKGRPVRFPPELKKLVPDELG